MYVQRPRQELWRAKSRNCFRSCVGRPQSIGRGDRGGQAVKVVTVDVHVGPGPVGCDDPDRRQQLLLLLLLLQLCCPILSPDGRSEQELQLDAVGRRGSLRFSHCTLLKHFR